MDISISSHVLDQEAGGPAPDLLITLHRQTSSGWEVLAQSNTDADGRVGGWQVTLNEGSTLRIDFGTGPWFEMQGKVAFYPRACVEFSPAEPGHYHIPLLLNRHGYSTYRGS